MPRTEPDAMEPTPVTTSGVVRPEGKQGASILIVDPRAGEGPLVKTLASRYALVETVAGIEAGDALRKRCHFDIVIVDMGSSGAGGVAWLRGLREEGVRADVIFMTEYADLDTAIAALRAGAADLLVKPFQNEQLLASVQRCLGRRQMMRENLMKARRETPVRALPGILGHSESIKDIHGIVERLAPTSSTVLIEGETGTGKELVARAIHRQSGRKGPFVAVNCGAISPELLESELFGHTRGAFTGAHSSREGLFLYADGGTLFLDEIGEMALPLQANLLRALEEKRVRPVGSDTEQPVNCRVISATNQPLGKRVAAGEFREDLYYRLTVLTINVPPLRDRIEDIPVLANHFSESLSAELGTAPLPFTHEDFVKMQQYPWPGNVRELKNVVERSLVLGKLPSDCCPPVAGERATGGGQGFPLDWPLAAVEQHHMLRVLESVDGNKSEAARRLGVSRKTLDRKLALWGDAAVPAAGPGPDRQ